VDVGAAGFERSDALPGGFRFSQEWFGMAQEPRRCPGITSQGKPCPLFPPAGRTWCINHDPERAAERHERSVRGGQNKAAEVRARKLLKSNLETMGDARDFILLSILEVRNGAITPKVAQAISALARTADALTVTDSLERQIAEQNRRIAQLEEALNLRDAARRAG
jgi:hypothetical protein